VNISAREKVFCVIIAILVFIIFGLSYAYLARGVLGKKRYEIDAGMLSLKINDGENNISLDNAYPMTSEEGLEQTPFLFSIENDGDKESLYTVYLIDDEIEVGRDRLDDKDLDYYLVREPNTTKEVQSGHLTELKTKTITVSNKEVTGRVLDTGTISKGNTKSYSLRVWLDYETGNDAMGKVFSVKLYVVADQIKDKFLIYDDGTGANQPDMINGLIPVIYSEEDKSWVKADITNKNKSWFDYGTQKWANAVTVMERGIKSREEYETAPVGTEIDMVDINTMWVWIPRYSYSIKSEDGVNYYGKGSTNKNLPGEIDVKFISEFEKESGNAQYTEVGNEHWLTHPAFTFGSDELTGLWVGKFETGGYYGDSTDASRVQIKPDITSWRKIQLSNMYKVGRKLQEEIDTFGFSTNVNPGLDSHMVKNSEWGSVAFLSQSKYGKYGNSNYIEADKELYLNNSDQYYTGRSGGSYSGNTPINGTYTDKSDTALYKNYGFYSYDDYLLDYDTGSKTKTKVKGKGTGASTTGNIYGVYDMSGGAWEYVMANRQNYSGRTARSYTKEEAILAGLTNVTDAVGVWNSGFNGPVFGKDYNQETGKWDIQMYVTNGTDFPDEKYYNLYTTTNHLTACDGKPCKGESYETGGWYDETFWFGELETSWINRGGSYNDSHAGPFRSTLASGEANGSVSFRLALVNID